MVCEALDLCYNYFTIILSEVGSHAPGIVDVGSTCFCIPPPELLEIGSGGCVWWPPCPHALVDLGVEMRGYRTLRVAGRATFWLSGAGKSVF
mgnify:CR=1 FL=1